MKYTKNDVYNAIRVFEDETIEDLDNNSEAVALACLREAYLNMQDTFELGDVLQRSSDVGFTEAHGVFICYFDEHKTHVEVLTGGGIGRFSSSVWDVKDVQKIGYIDMTDFVKAINGEIES